MSRVLVVEELKIHHNLLGELDLLHQLHLVNLYIAVESNFTFMLELNLMIGIFQLVHTP